MKKTLIVPFPAARLKEALNATNDAFKKLCEKRCNNKHYRNALREFMNILKEISMKN